MKNKDLLYFFKIFFILGLGDFIVHCSSTFSIIVFDNWKSQRKIKRSVIFF